MNATETVARPCPICGNHAYEWGKLAAHTFMFLPNDPSLLTRLTVGVSSTVARRCEACGNLQVFDKPTAAAGRP